MSLQDSTQLSDVRIVMLKGEKGEKGDGSYDDTEIRGLINDEKVARMSADASLESEYGEVRRNMSLLDSKVGNVDSELTARIDELEQNSQGYLIEELWSGEEYTGGTTVSLSKPITNFDYIDVYAYVSGDVGVYSIQSRTGNLFVRGQNLTDDASGHSIQVYETKCVFATQTMTIEFNHVWKWSGNSSASATKSSDDSGCKILKIVGRKCRSDFDDAEIVDLRVGIDGRVYPTAGTAVRTQLEDLSERIGEGQTEEYIEQWLNDHPEATTTVQDGSITEVKLATDLRAKVGDIPTEPCLVYAPFRSTAHQGDCTILKCGSEIVLVDFGTSDDAGAVVNFMVAHGLTRVTRCIITHFHYDHSGGYQEILGSRHLDFGNCTFYLHPQLDASQVVGNASYLSAETAVTNFITTMGYPIVYPDNDTITAFGELKCRWLNVSPTEWEDNNYYTDFTDSYGVVGTATNMNNFSIVTEFIHGKNHILLSGDIERLSQGVVEPYITVSPVIYKQEHHGVNEVANADYMAKINPEFTLVEGIGFVSHYFNNPISKHLMDNRSNIYVQAFGLEDTVIISDGFKASCLHGTANVINDDKSLMQEVTADNIDSLTEGGTYRLNGMTISTVNAGQPLYGFMRVYNKGSFIIQDCIILNGKRFSRSYTTSSGAWSVWHGDALSEGTATLDSTNVNLSATGNTITWKRVDNLIFVTGQVAISASPTSEWSTFTIASGLPTALFTTRSNALAVNQSGNFTSAIAVIGTDSGNIGINPRGASCINKTFQINLVYVAKQ